jgi:hypothetical protein
MNSKYPHTRYKDIVVQELDEEILVCDLKTNKVFCLNQTAGEVWKMCDGKTGVKKISNRLSRKLGSNINEDIVVFTLQELSKNNLLDENFVIQTSFDGLSRRQIIRRIGLASMIALPVIASVIMPTAANAQSGCPVGEAPRPVNCPCTVNKDCASGCCLGDRPVPICGPTIGADSCMCTSNAECDFLVLGLVCCAPSNPVCSPGC